MPRSRKIRFGLSWATPVLFGNFNWGQQLSERYRTLTQAMTTEGSILVEIYLSQKTLYLSDRQVIVDDTYEYEPVVEDFGVSDLQAGNNIAEFNDITITCSNRRLGTQSIGEKFSDLLNSYSFIGRKVIFKQYFDGIAYDETCIFHSGKIQDISCSAGQISISITNDDEVYKDIPVDRISKQAYPYAPKESVGLAKPYVYGKSLSNTSGRVSNQWTLSPGIILNDRLLETMVAGGIVGEPGITSYSDVFQYIPEVNHYMQLSWTGGSYSNTAAGAIWTPPSEVDGNIYLTPKIQGSEYSSAVSDYSSAIDENTGTDITLSASEKYYLKFDNLPNMGPIRYGSTNLFVYLYVSAVTGASPYGLITYYNPDYDNGTGGHSTGQNITGTGYLTYNFGADMSAHGEADDQSDANDAWTFEELSKYEFGITVSAGCTIDLAHMWVNFNGIVIKTRQLSSKFTPGTGGRRR